MNFTAVQIALKKMIAASERLEKARAYVTSEMEDDYMFATSDVAHALGADPVDVTPAYDDMRCVGVEVKGIRITLA